MIKLFFSLSIVLFMFSKNALGIDVQLKKEEIEYAIKKGTEYGKDIFWKSRSKYACINFWQRQGGGILVRSKFDGDNRDRHDFVTSNFLYNKLDPNVKSTIIVKGPFHEREYNIYLSRIK